VRRILRTALRFGWLDRDQTGLSIPRYNIQGRQVALTAARESMTLLKNAGLLPLSKSKTKSILIIGPNAFPGVSVGGGSADVQPFAAISYLEGLANYAGKDSNNTFQVFYDRGLLPYSDLANATDFTTALTGGEPGLKAEYFNNEDLKGAPTIARVEAHVDYGTAARLLFPEQTLSSRWTGYYTPQDSASYDIFVQTTREVGGSYRLYVDDKLVLDNWTTLTALVDYQTLRLDSRPHKIVLEQHGRAFRKAVRLRMGVVRTGQFVNANAKKLATSADVVVVAAGFDQESEAESADRTFRLPLGQEELIQEMAAANKKTIVVMTAGGGVDMSAWLDRVPALVHAWYPGQEGGTALSEILFGDVNPSGRLPVTFERRWEDNPVHDSYYPEAGTKRVVYKEGVFVGYRGYERSNIKPLFPFGFGLSYTTFAYSNISIKPKSSSDGSPRYEVSFDVKNTGTREGAEVAQVYVGAAQTKVLRPAKELKGFFKVNLRPGEIRRVAVILDSRALSYYDVNAKQWRAEAGDFNVLVGRSSEQIELRDKLTLATAHVSK